jgi:hypothetical protein
LSQDGLYIIYMHFINATSGHHTLSLIKKGEKIIFFCPWHGIAEFSGPACQAEFLRWVKLESESGSMNYFSPRVIYYAEVARIPLPIEKGAAPLVMATVLVPPSQGLCGTCGKPAGLKCSRCGIVSYCNGTCQAAHWPVHKLVCKKKP